MRRVAVNAPVLKGLKESPLKGPLGLYIYIYIYIYRGFMRLYKGYIRVI